MQRLLDEFLETMAMVAPFLLLGFLIAGLLHAFVPRSLLARAMGGSGIGPITRASLMGIPLPLCSCSVIPVATELRIVRVLEGYDVRVGHAQQHDLLGVEASRRQSRKHISGCAGDANQASIASHVDRRVRGRQLGLV